MGQRLYVTLKTGERVAGKIASFVQVYPGSPDAFWLMTVAVDEEYRHLTLDCEFMSITPTINNVSLLN